MTFKDQMTEDLSVFFNSDEFADSVIYSGVSIYGVLTYGDAKAFESGRVLDEATLFVKVSDVAAPDYRDSVVIGSDTWLVSNVIRGDGYVWELAIERDVRPVM